MGIQLKLCRTVYNTLLFYCRCLSTLVAMATLNFHRLINEKNENWHLWLFHCRYFDESFSEMLDELSSIFVQSI